MGKIFFFIAFSLFTFSGISQNSEFIQKEAMKKINWLLGEWQGETRVQIGKEFSITKMNETVRSNLGGTIFTIAGIGMDADTLAHDAFAVISYNVQNGKYQWNAWRNPGGSYTEVEFSIGNKSFEWSMDVKGGKTRYKAFLSTTGQWVETGEFSPDGVNWKNFLTMTLSRIKN